jgi:hypothetical protein
MHYACVLPGRDVLLRSSRDDLDPKRVLPKGYESLGRNMREVPGSGPEWELRARGPAREIIDRAADFLRRGFHPVFAPQRAWIEGRTLHLPSLSIREPSETNLNGLPSQMALAMSFAERMRPWTIPAGAPGYVAIRLESRTAEEALRFFEETWFLWGACPGAREFESRSAEGESGGIHYACVLSGRDVLLRSSRDDLDPKRVLPKGYESLGRNMREVPRSGPEWELRARGPAREIIDRAADFLRRGFHPVFAPQRAWIEGRTLHLPSLSIRRPSETNLNGLPRQMALAVSFAERMRPWTTPANDMPGYLSLRLETHTMEESLRFFEETWFLWGAHPDARALAVSDAEFAAWNLQDLSDENLSRMEVGEFRTARALLVQETEPMITGLERPSLAQFLEKATPALRIGI